MFAYCILHFALVISKLEYASLVWNSIASTDSNILERIQQKFVSLRYDPFFPHVHYSYTYALECLQIYTLRKRSYHFNALFHIKVYFGSKFYPLLEILVLAFLLDVPEIFYVQWLLLKFPSSRCTSAVNVVFRDTDIFKIKTVALIHIS
jgi:hypothetical protein